MKIDQLRSFHIAFHQPKYWWIPIDLMIGNKVFHFKASGVMNDPMGEIVAAACSLLKGNEAVSIVNFWREPKWHSLVFEPSMNSEQVTLSLCLNQDAEMKNGETAIEVTTSTLGVCQSIIDAYQDLLGDIGINDYEAKSGWGKPFRASEVDELARLCESIA